jgi:hypothetical protein
VALQTVGFAVHDGAAALQTPREHSAKVWAEHLKKLGERHANPVAHAKKGSVALAAWVAVELKPHAPRAALKDALAHGIHVRVRNPRLQAPLFVLRALDFKPSIGVELPEENRLRPDGSSHLEAFFLSSIADKYSFSETKGVGFEYAGFQRFMPSEIVKDHTPFCYLCLDRSVSGERP